MGRRQPRERAWPGGDAIESGVAVVLACSRTLHAGIFVSFELGHVHRVPRPDEGCRLLLTIRDAGEHRVF